MTKAQQRGRKSAHGELTPAAIQTLAYAGRRLGWKTSSGWWSLPIRAPFPGGDTSGVRSFTDQANISLFLLVLSTTTNVNLNARCKRWGTTTEVKLLLELYIANIDSTFGADRSLSYSRDFRNKNLFNTNVFNTSISGK